MTDTLTTLITRVQAQLIDDGTLFSDDTCTAAVRSALAEFNRRAPIHAGTLLASIAGQLTYALNDADFSGLLDIYGAWIQGTNDDDQPITADLFFEDNAPFIRLREPLNNGQTMIIRYALPHTVSGLDAAAESTLTADQDQALVYGACAEAIHSRLASRVETINLAADVVERYRLAEAHFSDNFNSALARYAARLSGVGVPAVASWNDTWHAWEQ